MAEEAMEARPMSLADTIAAVDEFSDIAVPHRDNPSRHEGEKNLITGLGEDDTKGTENRVKGVRKMIHGRPSLAFGNGLVTTQNAKEAGLYDTSISAKLELRQAFSFLSLE